MKATRALVVALCLSLALGCGDHTPTAVQAPVPEASLIGALLGPTGLLKCSDLPYASSTQTIGLLGGTISAGPHKLVIPPGALTSPTTITMTAPTGRGVNAVRFQPEGLQFLAPAALTMSYANCNLLGKLLPKRIAYTDENLNILYYLLSFDNLFSKQVTGKVNHFSDYVVAW
ncbi:MAG TPA: hypothetical protein VGQ48_12805 [Gemmatimonadales bacterium]|jgi:hypothetical protein|nr:hypothetical protein [Gemmatimonadales bacterium]